MTLCQAIEQYIAGRQSLGIRTHSADFLLRSYGRSVGQEVGCDEDPGVHANNFLESAPSPINRALRHSALAGFYRYAVARSITSLYPLPAEAPRWPASAKPYIYSRDELRRLLDATDTYRKPGGQLEPRTFRTVLLLLYGAGLRVGEALRLALDDVDLPRRLLRVRNAKGGKTRWVPLGQQLSRRLEDHAARRQASAAPRAGEAVFFTLRNGKPLRPDTVRRAFAQLRRKAGVSRDDGAYYQPRLHDLRHSFAVHRLTAWYRQGADVQRLLPLLSTYLGHASVAATQVYLEMTPELLRAAAERFECFATSGQRGDHA